MESENSSLNDSIVGGDIFFVEAGVFYCIGVVFSLVLIFGVAFTLMILFVFAKTQSLRTPSNMLIMSMVVADFLMLVCGLPGVISSSFNRGHMLGTTACLFEGSSMTSIGLTIICLLTAISADRYLIIWNIAPPKITMNKMIATIVVCYLYGILWGLFPFMGFGRLTLELSRISCGPDWASDDPNHRAYGLAMFVFLFFLPLVMMMFFYTLIIVKVKQKSRWRQDNDRNEVTKRQHEVTVSIVFIIVTFLLCWTPYVVVSFWSLFNDVTYLSPVAAISAPLMAKMSAVLNPLIYVIKNKTFRKAFEERMNIHLKCFKRKAVVPAIQLEQTDISMIQFDNTYQAVAAMANMVIRPLGEGSTSALQETATPTCNPAGSERELAHI